MMTIGNWKRSIGGPWQAVRKSAQCRAVAGGHVERSTRRRANRRPYTRPCANRAEAAMDLSHASIWWIAAGVAVAAELASGTFYLLMIALGLGAGALAAHSGATQPVQLLVAAVVGGGATVLWHWRRVSRAGPALPTAQD